MASVQLRAAGRCTGSRPRRGLLWPCAATLRATASMASTWLAAPSPVSAVTLASCALLVAGTCSPRHPGQLEALHRDQLALHLVDPAAERHDGVALGLHVEPPGQLGGPLVGQVSVPAHHLDELSAEPLYLLGA